MADDRRPNSHEPSVIPQREARDMRMGWGSRKAWAVVAVWAMVTAANGAEVEVENLRIGFAGNTQNNLFKIGTWTPVWVQLKGGGERFTGMMEVEVPDDDGTPTYFRQVVDVA